MCNTRNSRFIEVQGRRFRVDGCMAEKIGTLNKIGCKTLACCCGHGRYKPTIIEQDSDGTIYERYTGTPIPRKRNFYKTDNDGYYYIPELQGGSR